MPSSRVVQALEQGSRPVRPTRLPLRPPPWPLRPPSAQPLLEPPSLRSAVLPPPMQHWLGSAEVPWLAAFEAPRAAQEELAAIAAKLEVRSSQVSFKALYTAVLALKATHGDHCPACDTPLADVKSNPFERATAGLADLKELGELQEQLATAEHNVATASRELGRQLGCLSAFLAAHEEQETPVGRFLVALPVEPAGEWWSAVYPARPPQEGELVDVVTLETILAVADRIAAQDAASALARQERQQHINERAALVALQLAIQAQDLKRKQLVDGVAAAKARIAAFEVDNAQLIADVAQEALDLARDAPIKAAYDRFLALLRGYRNQLPGMLMAGLNDAAINLYNKPYKITDRDGMYALVSPAGSVTFRYDYRINGRGETLTIGRYGKAGISLAAARDVLSKAKRSVGEGRSPAMEKQRDKHRLAQSKTFGEFANQWLEEARMADTTRSMRKSILVRDLTPAFGKRLMSEISADDLRALCQNQGAGSAATAVHARDIVKQI